MSSDHKYFNCSEDYEIQYVSNLYKDKDDQTVKEFLKEKCKSKKINYSTHDEVYELLENNGFVRK
ncbi:hypothetical protein [Aliarcobacter skirrowii]|uniref:hypothetical protein n=1 Tax=Aliarcobacter skirrowii TaxID=28200 RepID=UPI0029BA3320|nr:hypothetical protein [Aliarcobacter skirrowii]MDX4028364.1 hypothetical protein [Aliarcobacter skirrowii]